MRYQTGVQVQCVPARLTPFLRQLCFFSLLQLRHSEYNQSVLAEVSRSGMDARWRGAGLLWWLCAFAAVFHLPTAATHAGASLAPPAILDAGEAGWSEIPAKPLPGNLSERSIMFVDEHRGVVFLFPQAFTAGGVSTEPAWFLDPVACTYTANSADTLLYLPLEALQASSSSVIGDLEWKPWGVPMQNTPPELLWPQASVYLPRLSLLVSYSGYTIEDATDPAIAGAHPGCASTFFSSSQCLLPSYRTHILDVRTMVWTSLSANETGGSLHVPGMQLQPGDMAHAFLHGIQLLHDETQQGDSRLLAFGGYLNVSDVAQPASSIWAFSLTNYSWHRRDTTGDVPHNVIGRLIADGAAFVDTQAQQLVVFGGTDWGQVRC